MGTTKKRIIVSVINDLVTDQRVSRTCHELHHLGFDVLLVGRKLTNSLPMPEVPYQVHRMKLIFTKGPLFYAFYNWRLFWLLIFKKADVLWSNDLDTLLANYMASKLKGKPVIFDSHEYFTEVPELEHNAFAKKVWKTIEGWIVPKLKHCITVNESIAALFKDKYQKEFKVIRNVPGKIKLEKNTTRKELGMPEDKLIIILQGSGINMHRGSEELVEAFKFLPPKFHLYIVGNGDVLDMLKKMVIDWKLETQVTFIGKQPYAKLIQYTMNADAGVTLDKDTNINYRFSLPNKIFDYIQSGIPVISSDLVELKKIIQKFQVGVIVKGITPSEIANAIQNLFEHPELYQSFRQNTIVASQQLNWEVEKRVLHQLMKEINH
jgi:glycosyltransferase involved in cell wall biosynthesis